MTVPPDPGLAPGPPIVSPEWLAEHYDDVVVADVRWYLDGRSGYDAYLKQRLPGAVFVDLDRCLAGPPSAEEGRHPLPTPAAFASAMTSLGMTNGATVVAYDDDGGRIAARLVWLLRVTGQSASLLDGGTDAWPGPFQSGPVGDQPSGDRRAAYRPGAFEVAQWPASRLASAEEVVSATIVLDARAPERYRGEVEPVDPRPGHIPGAINAPTAANLDETGRFKSPEALRATYQDLGVGPGSSPVVYCGSGVTACHDLLALERAGLGGGRLYPGSWSQWSADPARPIE
jgi:thiosulfate/3-mercaptopyruvate sulfurtransferase